jgi:hypothetical protein
VTLQHAGTIYRIIRWEEDQSDEGGHWIQLDRLEQVKDPREINFEELGLHLDTGDLPWPECCGTTHTYALERLTAWDPVETWSLLLEFDVTLAKPPRQLGLVAMERLAEVMGAEGPSSIILPYVD